MHLTLRETLLGSYITLLVLNTEGMAPECLPPNGKVIKDPPWPVKKPGRLQIPLQIQFCPDKSPEEQWGNVRSGKTDPSPDFEGYRFLR